MADATSSGGSGHSERSHKKTHHRTCGGEAVQYLNGDREVARQAVAIVLGATARKRGLTGAISICTEVSHLLRLNRSLERRVIMLRRELDLLLRSKKSSPQSTLSSSSTESNGLHIRRSTQTKTTQVQPVLTDRSTSPLLKEIHVKSSSHRSSQTEISGADIEWSLVKDTADREQDVRKELQNGMSEQEVLKKKHSLLPMITESQTPLHTVSQPAAPKHHDQQTKGKNISPVPPAQRQTVKNPVNQEIELPQIPQTKAQGEMQDDKPKICVHQQRKRGFRPSSSPVKMCPNPPVQRQPVKCIEMYSQCKCPGCIRALAEESVTTWCDKSHTDKKSPKQSEILPCLGDHVVARTDLTGEVKYIGPLTGEKQSYIGLHLDSPVGQHSGSLDGVQYFSCPPNYGAFVRIDDVLCITSRGTLKEKEVVGSSVTVLQRSSPTPTSGRTKHKKAQGS
ncbi:uncharacterized protein LOC110068989 isoform X2 [Orbicella faveolata]|uniref:uncharacterized protein LOC110068989 isoform X2 n=1 Tax=Orbicella faveolata TaxID=48498 RepID=UPI0009E5E013|nr:uncharacterized protein LOC110068989 isoform X2 [Orbicella faveolata]